MRITLAERDYFAYHRDHPGAAPYVSAPVQNKVNGKWTFYLSRRIDGAQGARFISFLSGVLSDIRRLVLALPTHRQTTAPVRCVVSSLIVVVVTMTGRGSVQP